MPYSLDITSSKSLLSVTWEDVEQLSRFANLQSGFYLEKEWSYKEDLLLSHFKQWNQLFWNQRQNQGMFDLPDGASILDIGCGMAVVDLLLYSFIPNSKFYLLDQEAGVPEDIGSSLPTQSFTATHPFYHSWGPVKDAIETSKFDSTRFSFLNTDDNFPNDIDAITSYFSWCFHYPKEVYWNKALNSLKTGGKLIVDVRPLADRDIIGEISEELKSTPVTFAFPILEKYLDQFAPVDNKASGYRCMWIKNK